MACITTSHTTYASGGLLLHEFITEQRNEIITRCRAKMSSRAAPRPTEQQLEEGVPLFLDQIAETLRLRLGSTPSMAENATSHGGDLLRRGFTIAQVVHDYGDVCQSVTELAVELGAQITALEFKTFNLCLDDSIAQAVTEYGRLRAYDNQERLGHLAHALGRCLNGALLSFDLLKSGKVGIGGITGAVLGRSLTELRDLVGHELAEVRIGSGVHHRERIVVRELIEDLEVGATMEANVRSLQFSAGPVALDVVVEADRQIVASVLASLTQNALRFSQAGGLVSVTVRTPGERVLIDVADRCGGLPPGMPDTLFDPHAERGARAIGGELHVRDLPGTGCVFTLELPRQRG